jgi:dTDP-4-amino-4,6-dideoxygalactose transaminase
MIDLPYEPLDPADWEHLLGEATTHRIDGLLARAVASGALAVDDAQATAAVEAHVKVMAGCLTLEATLFDLLPKFDQAGIEVAVLRGAAAAHLDYPDPALRPFGDIDMLVLPEQIDRASDVLTGVGFAPWSPRTGTGRWDPPARVFVADQQREIDLYAHVIGGPLSSAIPTHELWRDLSVFELAGVPVRALSPEARLISACLRAPTGSTHRLIGLRDVVQLVLGDQVDAEHVHRRARRWGVRGIVASAVAGAWRTFSLADAVTLSTWARRYRSSAAEASLVDAYRQPSRQDRRWRRPAISLNLLRAGKNRPPEQVIAAKDLARRIHLSPPHMGRAERDLLLDAFESNWVAPIGPHIDMFEREMARYVGVADAAALSSGTASLHLAMHLLGVGAGDEVLMPSLTFVATANAVDYVGGSPVFIDSDPSTWTIDPDLLAEELARRTKIGRLPKAVIAVDLYGQCADYDRILPCCASYEVPVVEDAAEALGATYRGTPGGSFGTMAVLSFNGNKIITTGGGGMLVSRNRALIERARYLATQARQRVAHYEHNEIGFNYRASNLLAAIGIGQLRSLDSRLAARRANNEFYRRSLAGVPGIRFMPVAGYGKPNFWLTCITIDPDAFGATREQIRSRLDELDIEARPTWKPMHLQPVFDRAPVVGGRVAEQIFATGLCLPSGSSLTADDRERVVDALLGVRRTG